MDLTAAAGAFSWPPVRKGDLRFGCMHRGSTERGTDRSTFLPPPFLCPPSPSLSLFSILRQVIARAEMCLRMTSNTNHPLNCVSRKARNDSSVHVSKSCVCVGSRASRFLSLIC